MARVLLAHRLEELEARRRGRALGETSRPATLEAFAAEHLVAKAKAGKVTERWLTSTELHLRRAVSHFGAKRDLRSIGVADVRAWVVALQETETNRGHTMDGGSVRHHLNALSNLYRRAGAEAVVAPGYNPAAALMEKPSARIGEAKWLEVHEAALPTGERPSVPIRAGRLGNPIRLPAHRDLSPDRRRAGRGPWPRGG